MKISKSFPSKWLKSDDIPNGKKIKVTMEHVAEEDLGGETKPILYFVGKEKGLVMNVTNANRISSVFGDETDAWAGKEIFLYKEKVAMKGQLVDGIRVDVPRPEVTEEEEPPF